MSFLDRKIPPPEPGQADWRDPTLMDASDASDFVLQKTGVVIGLNDAGHAYVAGTAPTWFVQPCVELTPRLIAAAVSYVEQAARPWRRELLVRQWRDGSVVVARPLARARPQRRRESHARPARRRAAPRGGGSDDPDLGESEPPAPTGAGR